MAHGHCENMISRTSPNFAVLMMPIAESESHSTRTIPADRRSCLYRMLKPGCGGDGVRLGWGTI
jgi:hypothetical protein